MADPLLQAALDARENAFAPYSKFKVGAGLTMCAERVAVFKAVSEGARRFKRVAVAADTDKLTPPCGACRQILWEFCGDVEIALVNPRGRIETYRLKELFPKPFDGSYL
jgi:cytidine deaminase